MNAIDQRFLVRRVAVLGSGVMGAQIAAHLTNAGVDTVLFDLPTQPETQSSNQTPPPSSRAIAERAIAGLRKLSPAPLGLAGLADAIQPADYEHDLALLGECDLIIEAIAERLDWKHDLYRRIAPMVAPHAVLASNTSGLSIGSLAQALPEDLKARFCGVHFFNPPRYMHLAELIPIAQTRADVLDRLEGFLTSTLGKGVVRTKDTPNFIANRIGVFGMVAVMIEAERHGLTMDVVDDLTGARLGRAKSGTYRTADVVGLDTLSHVIRTMDDQLPDDPFHALYAQPALLQALLAAGALGQKSDAGFYRREGKAILRIDSEKALAVAAAARARGTPIDRSEWATAYVPAGAKADETVARILKKKTWSERLQLLRESTNPQARFLWSVMRDSFHYAAIHLGDIAASARELDLAVRWGFGWGEGPFELWQLAGWTQVAQWIAEDIAAGEALVATPLPAWVFAGPVAQRGGVHQTEGSWSPTAVGAGGGFGANPGADPGADLGSFIAAPQLPVMARQLFPAGLVGSDPADPKIAGHTVFEDESVRLWTLDRSGVDDVLILSFKTKMHLINQGLGEGLLRAVEVGESHYRGVVIWSPDEPFSAGADLESSMPAFMKGGPKAVEGDIKKLQDVMLRMRYAQVPVVAAVHGMALGGGCEIALHCAKRVVALESYMGLVEVGVGLIPGAGGLAHGARRAAELQAQAPDAPLFHFLRRHFQAAAMATVSKSALEARELGYLLPTDPIVFHARELLFVAIRQVQAMADAGYRAPRRAKFKVAGREGAATFKASIVNLRDGGFASPHDAHLGFTIAEVMCGGDVDAGTEVDEAWIMALERQAFTALLAHPKTQERIMGLLQTGKPVRN